MASLLFAQGDGTLLVQSDHPLYDTARLTLMAFAQLVQRVDPIHVYQVRPVTLWQAASLALTPRGVLTFLREHTAHPLPYPLQQLIVGEMAKWGKLSLQQGGRGRIALRGDALALRTLARDQLIRRVAVDLSPEGIIFPARLRAEVKRIVCSLGYPVLDLVGYQVAPPMSMRLRSEVSLRPYQAEAVEQFFSGGQRESGIVVLPCGAGKTVVGLAIIARLQLHALILTPSESAALQWERECLEKTTLSQKEVCLYEPDKPLCPITITTYQRVTARTRSGERKHLRTLTSYPWGMVVYDEVHMLPAPLFRLAADLQGARRLGLTATLVREDGADAEVFSLIGSKCYEVPWRQLEQQGYLSRVRCVEVMVPLHDRDRDAYETATPREKHRIAALNGQKLVIVDRLLAQHRGDGVLIIGHYLDSLRAAAERFGCPLITGQTPIAERERVLEQFRRGEIRVVALSRVANMAIDLPSASVAIQISGLFGS
ncbi:MAG: DEAD/DEAH box helicase, partial [Alicyclobacillus sp.]|nr:DEAD/DEAH box helicase [Alicyclobacillus sp.]